MRFSQPTEFSFTKRLVLVYSCEYALKYALIAERGHLLVKELHPRQNCLIRLFQPLVAVLSVQIFSVGFRRPFNKCSSFQEWT